MKFIKKFTDAYSLSREYFFLDMLNQYGAPVPKVFQNNSEKLEIEMQFAGVDMHSWLHGLDFSNKNQFYALKALFKALESVKKVSDLGVWHLDLAFRNFLIDTQNSSEPNVYIIDFSLAISSQLPLQKPLWIRPDSNLHHPDLKEAVVSDWTNFFVKANLSVPMSFEQSFDIPLNYYSQIWLNSLHADSLSKPWCVISHSLGVLLQDASNALVFDKKISAKLNIFGSQLKNLTSDQTAFKVFNDVLNFIQSQTIEGTPRPTVVYSTSMPKIISTQSSVKSDEILDIKFVSLASSNNKIIYPYLAVLFLISIVYVTIDSIIWKYKIVLSNFTLWSIIFVALLSGIFILLGIFIRKKRRWFLNILALQSLIFLVIAFDFWVNYRLNLVSLIVSFFSLSLTIFILYIHKKIP